MSPTKGVLGTDNMEKLLDLTLDMIHQTVDVLEDNKVKWLELTKYVDELLRIPSVAENWPGAKAEWNDGLDEADRARLKSHFQIKFDIPNDEVELDIEDALEIINRAVSLGKRIRDRKRAKKASQA